MKRVFDSFIDHQLIQFSVWRFRNNYNQLNHFPFSPFLSHELCCVYCFFVNLFYSPHHMFTYFSPFEPTFHISFLVMSSNIHVPYEKTNNFSFSFLCLPTLNRPNRVINKYNNLLIVNMRMWANKAYTFHFSIKLFLQCRYFAILEA